MSFFPGLQDKGVQYLQAVANANNISMDRVEYIKKKKTKLTVHDTHQKKVFSSQFEPPIKFLVSKVYHRLVSV